MGEYGSSQLYPEHTRLAAQARIFGERERQLAAVALGPRPRTLLDVGCGPGAYGAWIAERVGGVWTGVELDEARVEFARGLGVYDEVRSGDFITHAPSLGGFDAALCRLLLRHVPDPQAIVGAMAAAVRPGGRVLLIDTVDSSLTLCPAVPAFDEALAALHARVRARGADPNVGRRLLGLARAAGLEEPRTAALTLTVSEDGVTAPAFVELLRPFTMPQTTGWDEARGEAVRAALRAWATSDAAFGMWTMLFCWGRTPA